MYGIITHEIDRFSGLNNRKHTSPLTYASTDKITQYERFSHDASAPTSKEVVLDTYPYLSTQAKSNQYHYKILARKQWWVKSIKYFPKEPNKQISLHPAQDPVFFTLIGKKKT